MDMSNKIADAVVETTDIPLKPLISVIVPIYNVEKYVRKCLDSLLHQTMKQIEVIAIDDGSTDESGRIADDYKSDDWPIFRVIHTENRGLSAARNRGIDEARAEWLMFVDSDDWVDRGFSEISYRASQEYGADMVIFGVYWLKKNGKIRGNRKKKGNNIKIVDVMTALEYCSVVAWNKLYHKSLFDCLRYPEGMLYEDKATTHKAVMASKKIIMMEKRLYYHTYRKESITHSYSADNRKDCFISALKRYNDLLGFGYPKEKVIPQLCSSAMGFLASSRFNDDDDELRKEAEKIIDSVKCFPRTYPLWKKISLFAWKVDKRVFYFMAHVVRDQL